MKAFRIFIALCGVMTIIWMTVSLFNERINPSPLINALIIGALFILLGVENWIDDQKKYAAFYILLAFIPILSLLI
ncbi:hypothetical protein GLW00_13010 [Halobacillus litoralis]|uniref:DUF3953 domain-containing protein n=1 Tax=Halobacillus litoralis TaxID=45668 RepID=A0A845FCW2_9BACI|nr:hypothetical protein [Halobacillus litoralis]MYL71780.1 hypothetical protein [Halobacillus litoralis]